MTFDQRVLDEARRAAEELEQRRAIAEREEGEHYREKQLRRDLASGGSTGRMRLAQERISYYGTIADGTWTPHALAAASHGTHLDQVPRWTSSSGSHARPSRARLRRCLTQPRPSSRTRSANATSSPCRRREEVCSRGR